MGNKNLSPADRKRIRQNAEARKAARENRLYYILIAITLVVVAFIFITPVVKDFFTLPAEIRDLSAIEPDWLVIDTDRNLPKRYHHPASLTIPEGYVKGDFSKYRDGVAQDFYLVSTDENAPVSSIHVDASANLTAEAYIQRSIGMYTSALTEGSSVTMGEPFTATIAGEEAQCIYMVFSTPNGSYSCLFCGFDAPRNVCVTAVINGSYTTADAVLTQDAFLAQAQTLLAGLTIVR